MGIEGSV